MTESSPQPFVTTVSLDALPDGTNSGDILQWNTSTGWASGPMSKPLTVSQQSSLPTLPSGTNGILYSYAGSLWWANSSTRTNLLSAGISTPLFNLLAGTNAGNSLTTGDRNVALGYGAYATAITANSCVAIGYNALNLSTGSNNIGIGDKAGASTSSGGQNVIIGTEAAFNNLTGSSNVVIGYQAAMGLTPTSINATVAIGPNVLEIVEGGSWNTAVGAFACSATTSGSYNVSMGPRSLLNLDSGSNNVAIGYQAGSNYTSSETRNIVIGYNVLGAEGDNTTIRIGDSNYMACYIGGIHGVAGAGIAVSVDADGRLTSAPSSAKYKENVETLDIGYTSKIYDLRPVKFNYKNGGHLSFGLIAEEVDEVFPEIVVRNKSGEIEGLAYDNLFPFLISIIQEQKRQLDLLASKLA